MTAMLVRLADHALSLAVPRVVGNAKVCGCDAGSTWCASATVRCRCNSDCVTTNCYCPINGCR
ncbi:hypothetical protein GCM10022379_40610 [Micromonospora maritima]